MMLQAMPLAVAIALACHSVPGDRILGKDLAGANPLFAPLDPDLAVGWTPIPGVRRVMHAQEIARIGRANHIAVPVPAPEMCFERSTQPLTPAKLLPVLASGGRQRPD